MDAVLLAERQQDLNVQPGCNLWFFGCLFPRRKLVKKPFIIDACPINPTNRWITFFNFSITSAFNLLKTSMNWNSLVVLSQCHKWAANENLMLISLKLLPSYSTAHLVMVSPFGTDSTHGAGFSVTEFAALSSFVLQHSVCGALGT